MSAGQQMPPWLQEQIGKMQQSQQNLQSILMQKQQVEMENVESDRALEELKKHLMKIKFSNMLVQF